MVDVPGIEKLIQYVTSGIGSAAGTLFAPQIAKRRGKALEIEARYNASAATIIAKAQDEVSDILGKPDFGLSAEFSVGDAIEQVVRFQQERRMGNTASVAYRASELLSGVEAIPDQEPDHDWTARFFNEVQDVSSKEMQELWAKVLAGQVQRPGSTSIKTLNVLRNLDKEIAEHFRLLCSMSIAVRFPSGEVVDCRALSFGRTPVESPLQDFGLELYKVLNLIDHELVAPVFNTNFKYDDCVAIDDKVKLYFTYQSKNWGLRAVRPEADTHARHGGMSMTSAGKELFPIVGTIPVPEYDAALRQYFNSAHFEMVEMNPSVR